MGATTARGALVLRRCGGVLWAVAAKFASVITMRALFTQLLQPQGRRNPRAAGWPAAQQPRVLVIAQTGAAPPIPSLAAPAQQRSASFGRGSLSARGLGRRASTSHPELGFRQRTGPARAPRSGCVPAPDGAARARGDEEQARRMSLEDRIRNKAHKYTERLVRVRRARAR